MAFCAIFFLKMRFLLWRVAVGTLWYTLASVNSMTINTISLGLMFSSLL